MASLRRPEGRPFVRGLVLLTLVGAAVRLMDVLWWRPTTTPAGLPRLHAHRRLLLLPLAGERAGRRGTGSSTRSAGSTTGAERRQRRPPAALLHCISASGRRSASTPSPGTGWRRALLGIAAVVVIGLLGYRLAGPAAGLVAAGIAAVYPQLWINDGVLLSESIVVLVDRVRAARHVQLLAAPDAAQRHVCSASSCGDRRARSQRADPAVPRRRDPAGTAGARHRLARRGSASPSWPASRARSSSCRGRSVQPHPLRRADAHVVVARAACSRPRTAIPSTTGARSATTTTASRARGPTGDESERDAVPREQALEYMQRPHHPAARRRRSRASVACGACSSRDRRRSSTGRSSAAGARRRGSGCSRTTCSLPFAVVGLVSLWRTADLDPPAARGAVIVTVRRRHRPSASPAYRAPAEVAIVLAAAVGVVATVGWLRGRTPARHGKPGIRRSAPGYARQPMTAGDPADRDPARRGRARAQHRAAPRRAPELPPRRQRLPALALRREPVRPRDPAPGRRRRRRPHRALRDDPAALPRARAAPVPAAFSLHAVVRTRHAAARAVPHSSGRESSTRRQAAGWQFASRRVQREVDRRGREVPGLEDARAAARCGSASPMHIGRGTAQLRGRRRVPRRSTFARARRRARRLPRAAGGRTRTPPSTCAWRLGVPAHVVRGARHRRARRASPPPTRRFGVRGRGDPEAAPPRRARSVSERDAIVGAACRFHRAPYAVYAGFNAHVQVRGIQPPRRLQPSPLHLILRSLSPATSTRTSLALDTFEFLDMDAY